MLPTPAASVISRIPLLPAFFIHIYCCRRASSWCSAGTRRPCNWSWGWRPWGWSPQRAPSSRRGRSCSASAPPPTSRVGRACCAAGQGCSRSVLLQGAVASSYGWPALPRACAAHEQTAKSPHSVVAATLLVLSFPCSPCRGDGGRARAGGGAGACGHLCAEAAGRQRRRRTGRRAHAVLCVLLGCGQQAATGTRSSEGRCVPRRCWAGAGHRSESILSLPVRVTPPCCRPLGLQRARLTGWSTFSRRLSSWT